jgi:hypothetical protein
MQSISNLRFYNRRKSLAAGNNSVIGKKVGQQSPIKEDESPPGDKLQMFKPEFQTIGKRIVLSLRGFKYEVNASIFSKYPNSRLGKLNVLLMSNGDSDEQARGEFSELCDHFDLKSNEFFFNKDPFVFNSILDLYNQDQELDDSKMHVNDGVCFDYLSGQLSYWGFEELENVIASCCLIPLIERQAHVEEEIHTEEDLKRIIEFKPDFQYKMCLPKLREKLYDYMETAHPMDYSRDAIIRRVN